MPPQTHHSLRRSALTTGALGLLVPAIAATAQTVVPADSADQFLMSPANQSGFGESVAIIADVNGDGARDIAVGAPGHDPLDNEGNPINNAGAYFIFSGLDGSHINTIPGFLRDGFVGLSIVTIPDLDADGIDDLACGAPGLPFEDDFNAGGVIFFSSVTGEPLGGIPGTLGDSTSLGASLAKVGDITGDGVDELLIGANGLGSGKGSPGLALLVNGADYAPLHTFTGEEPYSIFGTAVAGAGDVNGDGTPDVIIGAPLQDMDDPDGGPTLSDAGRAYVYSGADYSLLFSVDRYVDNTATQFSNFGTSVTGIGDINGDGNDDVLVGAPQSQQGSGGNGSIVAFSGADGSVIHDIEGTFATGEQHGIDVIGLNDLNGDGIPEFAGASSQECFGFCTSREGQVIVYDGATADRLFEYNGEDIGDNFGAALAYGDTNNDGGDDLVIASLWHNSGPDGPGQVYIFHGEPNDAVFGDLTGDGLVDVEDLLLLLSGWGTDSDGADLEEPTDMVDVADLLALLAAWS